jgi:hypothetical protein
MMSPALRRLARWREQVGQLVHALLPIDQRLDNAYTAWMSESFEDLRPALLPRSFLFIHDHLAI